MFCKSRVLSRALCFPTLFKPTGLPTQAATPCMFKRAWRIKLVRQIALRCVVMTELSFKDASVWF
jgi:hypothetical protein